ncbi:MAG: Holliday junction branch migration protein RuvA [Clostridia bacterium]|nr:Holliday junction branch migration protein RuvA [Clostridia bacterium]
MFYFISGNLAHLDKSFAVIDASGVGYKLNISGNTYFEIQKLSNSQNQLNIKLYTHMAVREDGVELFGFISEEELSSFKMLIGVSGVGPKAAISILSQLSPSKLALAICTDDKKAISAANGIGPKTAARIILELKDKFNKERTIDSASDSDIYELSVGDPSSSKFADAQDALTVLGYSRSEAAKVLGTIDTQNLDLDEIIKQALKKLMKN